jgi:hypothetical protein
MTSEGHDYFEFPYWNPNASEKLKEYYCLIYDILYAPANRNGEGLMWFLKLDKSHGDPAYQYLPGQRRVKMAPEISYDGPNTSVAGASTYDDAFLYTGSPDRYDWKILGKKEMFVPYNQYKLAYHQADNPQDDEVIGPHHVNPDFVRWELHRVWVVEGTLKEGMRHIYNRRTLYIDEDTWHALMVDAYDNKDQFYRGMYNGGVYCYDIPAPYNGTYYGYDFISEIWWYNGYLVGPNLADPKLDPSFWSPQSLAGIGLR